MKPILCRPGGKKRLVKELMKHIPPHKTYVEPFMGTGAVFFAKKPAEQSMLGDNDKRLMAFYKQVQQRAGLTCDLRRDETKFNRLKSKQDSKKPCDYVYIIKTSYGCIGEHLSQGTAGRSLSVQNFNEQVALLNKAKLHSTDFKDLIKKHDSSETFFYLDPPYHEKSCSYPKGSCDVSPKDVLDTVKSIKGKFLLSYNDHPDVRKTFCQKYKCKTVKTKYGINTRKDTPQATRKELLIKNY